MNAFWPRGEAVEMPSSQKDQDQQTRLFDAIASATPDFLYAFDLQGRFIYANRRLLEVWGIPLEKAIGKSLYDLGYPTWHADMHMREIRQVIETKQPVKGEVPFTGGSGISGIYEYIFNPVFDAEGRVELVIGTTRDVTERRRAEDANREAEQRWELAVRGTNDGIWDWNTVTGKLYWSPRCKEMLGYSDDELQMSYEVARELMHPEDRDRGREQSQRHLAGETRHFVLEYRLRHKDGSYRWILARGVAIRDKSGKAVRMAGSHTDITERRATEESLRRITSRLQLAVDVLGLGMWSVDLRDNVVEESDQFIVLLGLPPGTRHKHIEEWGKYLHPDDTERARHKFEGALTGICEYEDEQRLIGADGVTRWVHVKGTVVRDNEGKPIRVLGVLTDITRRKRDEDARAHLAAIVASSDDAIISKNLNGIIQSWNTGAQRIFGYSAEEAVGHSILMLIPPERHPEEEMILTRLRAGQRIEHFESVRVTKEGREIDVSLTISPIFDSDGRIIGASKVARDITRQKQAERELQVAKAVAEEANRRKDELLESERAARSEVERASHMKDEFLATLSHELRTPLNAILGWAQILRSNPERSDIAEGLEIIERNARAQTQIIEDLLDMSRIIAGKIRLDVQRLDLGAAVRSAVETVMPAANAKGVRVLTVFDQTAGPVSGDPSRLQQVFWNLLTNAVKFTPKGGRVQVVLERVNSHIEVSVIDSGEGIAPDFLPHVFDRFQQADGGTARKHGGLGLGLAIVKQLVELHGGSVRVTSGGINLGATFTVALPLTVIHPAPVPETERRHPGAARGVSVARDSCVQIEGVRVLVVDDEPDARALISRFLEDCKAVVSTAASAEEAIQLLTTEIPDVLVSDIGMPGEDGYSLIKRVRALGRDKGGNVPSIALTAYARAEDRMKAMLAGFEQYLVKPVEPAELITVVSILAARSRQR
jgi:PAS domain S-box-containing protein